MKIPRMSKLQISPSQHHSFVKHSKEKISEQQIEKFVKFCFVDAIAKQLENSVNPYELSVRLYKKITGIDIPVNVAKGLEGRYECIERTDVEKGMIIKTINPTSFRLVCCY